MAQNARWGGTIATYAPTVDAKGQVAALSLLEDRPNLLHFVKAEDFVACVKRWRFGRAGHYTILWSGGAINNRGTEWVIEVTLGDESVSLRRPSR